MNLLKSLTIKNLKLNRKRSVVTIIGIILAVALLTALSSLYMSFISSSIKFETSKKGNFHVAYYDVPVSEINQIKNNINVEDVYITKNIGYSLLKESKNKEKPYIFVKEFSSSALKNLSVNLVEGRLPKNENEIIIPTHLKTNGRVVMNIGDEITLDIGTRKSGNDELTQKVPYKEEYGEQITNTVKKTYKIVGIIERPATNIEEFTAPGYTFITYLNDTSINSGKFDVYTRYTKKGIKDNLKVTANIININEDIFSEMNDTSKHLTSEEIEKMQVAMEKVKYQFSMNEYLIKLETDPLSISANEGLATVVLIVLGIIIFTSVFCIKNSFNISIVEKTKQYGMLKSIGATKKQIKQNVLYEAFILGIIGIPIGIVCGIFASFLLIIIANMLLENSISNSLQFEFSGLAIILSIVLGVVTIYLSAIRGAKRASKVSPIESIRNSAEIKIKPKQLKTPQLISKLFGIGGLISYKNLKRNKKKYRTTVISIILSVATFIALFYFTDTMNKQLKNDFTSLDYNYYYVINNTDQDAIKKIEETTKLENIKNYAIYRKEYFNISKPKFSNEYKEAISAEEITSSTIEVISIGEYQYKKYIKDLGLKYEDIKDKGILIDKVNFIALKDGKTKKYNIKEFTYKNNDEISLNNLEQTRKINIGYITENKPFAIVDNVSNPILIVSDSKFDSIKVENSNTSVYFDSTDPDKLQDEVDIKLNGFEYKSFNIKEQGGQTKNIMILIDIFLYGFIIVISLIGITNVFNTITTNMELRQKEFAMLKSIGMTKKEFNKMINLESIFMCSKSLLFGTIIGLALSYAMYHYMVETEGIGFDVPFVAIALSITVVFILIVTLMKYTMKKINKQNTIETIRNENI